MDKNALMAFFALAFLLALPAAFAGIQPTPVLARSELKCGNCTNAWSQECRTLYRTDYYSNGAKTFSVQTAPQTDYTYCYNGGFVKIKFKESFKCSGSTSYKSLDSTGLPAWFKWKYGMDWPTYCPNGCNKATGKCNTVAEAAPKPPKTPQPQAIQPQPSQSTKPEYKWQCSGSPFDGYFRVKVKTTGLWTYTGIKEYCKYGCSNGKCTGAPAAKPAPAKPAKKCTPSHSKICKNGDVYMKYVYSDCSNAEFLYTDCGSCQTCQNGACKGPVGSTTHRAKTKTAAVKSNYAPVYGSTIKSQGGCTYNSECPSGYYCDTKAANICRPDKRR